MTDISTHTAGKAFRKGLSLPQLFRLCPDDETAEAWFIQRRWPNGITCPCCGSDNVQTGAKHKTMPYRCREKGCGKRFSTRTGTVMEASKLGYQVWIIAIYQLTTSLKGAPSMKLYRDLDINPRSAWFLGHRLRVALAAQGTLEADSTMLDGPVEIDETYRGGKRKSMSNAQRKALTGRGTVGKTIVAGAKDRDTNSVTAKPIPDTTRETLQGLVADTVAEGVEVCTDDHAGCEGIPNPHRTVRHSSGKSVDGKVRTNGIESFWSMFKRAHKGTDHKMSPKHLNRYITEFAAHHNLREQDTLAIRAAVAKGGEGKRLKYRQLIADNGLESGARSG